MATREPSSDADPADGQLSLVPRAKARRPGRPVRSSTPKPLAAHLPVAQVMVDTSLAHLDRPFDYAVPEDVSAGVQPGVRVRVRFAGTDVDAVVMARAERSDHEGRLTPISRLVSPVVVLTPEVSSLVRAVADRYAGTFADVLRAAVPPRHARAEASVLAREEAPDRPPVAEAPGTVVPTAGTDASGSGAADHAAVTPWDSYRGGRALLARVATHDPGADGPRAVWTATPGEPWAAAMAELADASHGAGHGVLWLVPDARDAARAATALRARLGRDAVEVLTADLGPSARYRAFLRVLLGQVRAVVGTRAAVFAPVSRLGLVLMWDDGDDLYSEPHAPGWHAREVAVMRSQHQGAALVLGSYARSVEAATLLADGVAREVVADRATVRLRAPRVACAGDDSELATDPAARTARLPHLAWRTAREGLDRGPVLVQVPRRGYLLALACRRCRALATCGHCHGPLAATSGHAVPTCRWCARPAGHWACPTCGDSHFRAVAYGSTRTAEELGRAFPGVPVRTSGRAEVLDSVDPVPALVVCTPGAEPEVEGGYAAALLLDGRVMLDRPDMRAGEEAVRRWLRAVALVRPAAEGGRVVLLADSSLPAAQAVVRVDPGTFAEREREERAALGLPPATCIASLTGEPTDVAGVLELLRAPDGAAVLGPVALVPGRRREGAPEASTRVRYLVTVPRALAAGLAAALHAAAATRAAQKSGGAVQVRVDPVELG